MKRKIWAGFLAAALVASAPGHLYAADFNQGTEVQSNEEAQGGEEVQGNEEEQSNKGMQSDPNVQMFNDGGKLENTGDVFSDSRASFQSEPASGFSAEQGMEGNFTVTSANSPLQAENNVYTVTDNVTVTGTTANQMLKVTADATITLDNVSMGLKECNGSPITIEAGKKVTIIVKGTNTLSAYAAGPGIQVEQGAELTVQADTSNDDKLTVLGATMARYSDGEVAGGQMTGFAGIGSQNSSSKATFTGTINIVSGTINVTGYGYGAAIGGGDYSSGCTINISGGIVTAINDGTDQDGWISATRKQASGIGASQGQASGKITISGNAKVTAYGGYACPGIGGGTSDVTIKDNAIVKAYGGSKAAGIGGYEQDKGVSQIAISGNADVTAYGGSGASGLGQGSTVSQVNLSISPGTTVLAYSDGTKAAITGTPVGDSNANILNFYMKNLTTTQDAIIVAIPQSGENNSTLIPLPVGYKAIGKTMALNDYRIIAPLSNQEQIYYEIVPKAGDTFLTKAGNDATIYGSGTETMLIYVSEPAKVLQLNPTVGVKITGTDTTPTLNSENGTVTVPAGATVVEKSNDSDISAVWAKGGTVSKDGTLTPVWDTDFAFTEDLPTSKNVNTGSSMSFGVTVADPQDGGVLSYQWYKNGEACVDETSASMTIDKVTDADLTSYYVVVTKTLGTLEQTLTSKTLTVTKAPSYRYYTLEATAGEHGTISPSGSFAIREYLSQKFVITPEDGYQISDIMVDGASVGSKSEYTFEQITGNHTIEASFTKIIPDNYPDGSKEQPDGSIITPNGTVITPDGTITLPDGTELKPAEDGSKPTIDKDNTVTAVDGTKYFADGSIQAADGTYLSPATPMLASASLTNVSNNVKAVLSGLCAGAQGYDYVISQNINCIKDKDYYLVKKNVSGGKANFYYVPAGTYYVYCHAWTRNAEGKKVFGKWSNYQTVTVTSITPEKPLIESVKVNGSTVRVTYTQCQDAEGYDLVLGSEKQRVNGEYRPINYGTLVKKVKNGETVTAVFKNVPAGTYYAGLHAWNRTSENGGKVFGPWSGNKKVMVK